MDFLTAPPPSATMDRFWSDDKELYYDSEALRNILEGRNRRFEADEPPEITSPPPEWNHTFLRHFWDIKGEPMPSTEDVLDSLYPIIDPPLVDKELELLRDHCVGLFDVTDERLDQELEFEEWRLVDLLSTESCPAGTYNYFKDVQFGQERIKILARHYIKRRWQRMGVWDKDWGIPGRSYPWADTSRDDRARWRMRDTAETWTDDRRDHESVRRFIASREEAYRGDIHLPPGYEALGPDASDAAVWIFITTRPWFIFAAEEKEEEIRFKRLGRQIREIFDGPDCLGADSLKNLHNRVIDMWKARGHWSPEWDEPAARECGMPGWWWPHEAPEPEPEDLAPLIRITEEVTITSLEELELTPSECEAFECVHPETMTPERYGQLSEDAQETEDRQFRESREATQALVTRYEQTALELAVSNPSDVIAEVEGDDNELGDGYQPETPPSVTGAEFQPVHCMGTMNVDLVGDTHDDGADCLKDAEPLSTTPIVPKAKYPTEMKVGAETSPSDEAKPKVAKFAAISSPIKPQGVKKRMSKKTQPQGPLRRSTRTAAIRAAAKLKLLTW